MNVNVGVNSQEGEKAGRQRFRNLAVWKGKKYEPWVRTLEGKFRTRVRTWSFRTPGSNIEFPNPGFWHSVCVRTLDSNSFSFEVQLQVQLQFKKFGVEFNLEFNFQFEFGVCGELQCSNSGFQAPKSERVWSSKTLGSEL